MNIKSQKLRKKYFLLLVAVLTIFLAGISWKKNEKVKCLLNRYVLYPPESISQRGNHGPAVGLKLFNPMGLAEDQIGNIYIVDRGRWRGCVFQGGVIWRIDKDRIAHAIAGTGKLGKVKEGVNTLDSNFGSPEEIAISSTGLIYFVDHRNHVVLRIEADGTLTRIAGTGEPGYTGDGGPAIKATLNKPYDIKFDSKGNLYVAEEFHRIRKISQEGLITTVAGTGEPGFSGDNGPATEAQLNEPFNILVDSQDRLLIADSLNHVIRRVDQNGIITTIAGTGKAGYSGDGGLALLAQFNAPQALFIDDANRLYIGDEHNHAIRMIDNNENISTLTGNGKTGVSDLGISASAALLDDPEDILVRQDGSILISDSGNGRVLEIGSDNIVRIFAGGGISPQELRKYKQRVVRGSNVIWK